MCYFVEMFVQTKGGGVKGLLNNVKKNCTFLSWWLPLHYSSNPVVVSQNDSEIDRLQTLSIIHWLNRTEQCIILDPLPKN